MKLTKTLILDTTELLVIKKGFEGTALSDVAKHLNVTHAALYKYYSNKEQIFEQLSLRWIEKMFKDLFSWNPINKDTALHDWLWLLSTTNKIYI